ncbi:MAG: CoA transferase [Acidimicrobiia bacterium]
MSGPLSGVKVLDLSQGAAGPTCAMHLGDLGAEVIKVEPPGGEWSRTLGPPFVAGVAAAFLGMNRNKRSVVVDLKQGGGSELVLRLAERCDVALESFRPGVADRLGIGYEAMAARNPALVYGAISAFGQTGPWRERPGVDGVAQAMGGIMSVTGTEEAGPVKVGLPAADMAAGAFMTQAILAGLLVRERSGEGQRVDVSLLDALLALQVVPLSMFLASGQTPRRLGSAAPYAAPNEAYATADGHVMVAAYTVKRWPALCKVLGRPELAGDSRFDDNGKRVTARVELNEVLAPIFATRTTAEWIEALEGADILCGPILDYPELMGSDHVASGGMIVAPTHEATGPVRSPRIPARFSVSDELPDLPAPPIPGEHTVGVLSEFGFSDEEIEDLMVRGVAAGPES